MNTNMVAPYEGTLEWVGTPAEGVSRNTGNPWKTVDFTLKFLDHQMRESFIVFSLSGVERVNALLAYPIGTAIRVAWTPGARKWENASGETKWFAQYNAVLVTQIQQQPPVQNAPRQQAPAQYAAPAQGYPQQRPLYQQAAQPQYAQPQFPGQPADPVDDMPDFLR